MTITFWFALQRYEELSTKWDQAKQEVRSEDHDMLREKIVLQQELIRRQDEYAEQRRTQQASEEAQVSIEYCHVKLQQDIPQSFILSEVLCDQFYTNVVVVSTCLLTKTVMLLVTQIVFGGNFSDRSQ